MKTHPYALVSRDHHPEDSVITIRGVEMGGNNLPVIIAGPCSVESREQILETAIGVKEAGAQMLRGCVYKPRTSPYNFQGLGVEGLPYLEDAGEITGLPTVTEAMDNADVDAVLPYTQVIQIGSRNGLNYRLISYAAKKVAEQGKVLLLKRQTGSSIDELLGAAEYAAIEFDKRGKEPQILLCLRGTKIGPLQEKYRNNPDYEDIPGLKAKTHLPVIFDPSHAAGKREYILPLSLAAMEYGADGLMIETHCSPHLALTDAAQQITPAQLRRIINEVNEVKQRENSLAGIDIYGMDIPTKYEDGGVQ